MKYPYGGMIGYGKSRVMDALLCWSKIIRLHAAFHDACGVMKMDYDVGPGYCYAPHSLFYNTFSKFYLGHFAGLLFWLRMKFTDSELYASILPQPIEID